MFDIGSSEFLLILILALLIFGPRRLPEIGKQIGGFVAQLRGSVRDFQGQLEREVALDDLREATKGLADFKSEAGSFARDITGLARPTALGAPLDLLGGGSPAPAAVPSAVAAPAVTPPAPAAASPTATPTEPAAPAPAAPAAVAAAPTPSDPAKG